MQAEREGCRSGNRVGVQCGLSGDFHGVCDPFGLRSLIDRSICVTASSLARASSKALRSLAFSSDSAARRRLSASNLSRESPSCASSPSRKRLFSACSISLCSTSLSSTRASKRSTGNRVSGLASSSANCRCAATGSLPLWPGVASASANLSLLLVVGVSSAASLADWNNSAWRAGSPCGRLLIIWSRGVIGLKSCDARSGSAGAAGFCRAKGPPTPQAVIQPATKSHAAKRNHLCGMSFFAGCGRLPHGEPHAEVRASLLGLENFNAAAVCIDEFGHHRQPDSRSLDMASLRRLSLVKGLEYPIALLGRNTRPAVDDLHHQLFAFAARMNRYGAAARGELDGIRQQVVEDQPHLAAVGERREILDVNIEPHALRHQRELLIFQYTLDQGPQLEFGNLQADALGLPGAERQQIFDESLQLHSVLAQDRRHFALAALQLADRAIHQEFGPFAYVCERRLQFMRHMSQKSVLFLRQIQQTASEPFQLRRQALEVGRSADGDGPGKRAAPELADGAVDRANGPAEQVGEYAHHRHCQGYEQQRLPKQIALRTLGRELQAG